MKVVGIDASTNKSGISLFIDGKYADHVLIDFHAIKDSNERVPKMMQGITKQLYIYSPDIIVMEECMMTNNIKTVKLLSYLAGAIIAWAMDHNIEFRFTLPTEWRKVVGVAQGPKTTREKLKEESIDMVEEKFGLEVTDDEAESILIAYSATAKENNADDGIDI